METPRLVAGALLCRTDQCELFEQSGPMTLLEVWNMAARIKRVKRITRIKRYKDRCYAVVIGRRRGPCAPDKGLAMSRFRLSGLIASATTDRRRRKAAP